MPVSVERLVLGPLQTNTYVLRSGTACWVVDPGLWPKPLLDYLTGEHLAPATVLLTHGHGDHIAGVRELKQAWPRVRVLCPAADAGMLADPQANLSAMVAIPLAVDPADDLVRPGQELRVGESVWNVLDTSGHTPGGVSYYCAEAGVVLTGDALFFDSIGRTDIPGGDARALVERIRSNLMNLPDDTRVLPGHGPETTIGRERRGNPFLAGG
jgi:glyoxylase-like metal-dependent hydrolase (beta-lactamase superfamily II)